MTDPDSYPEVEQLLAERRERFRLAGVNALNRRRGGRDLKPDARQWAERMAALPPLGRALSTGAPT